MAKIIFRLKDVPDDEAEEIRALLDQHGVPFYETSEGNWGVSMPAIWVRELEHAEAAKSLIEQYQADRTKKMQEIYLQEKLDGRSFTIRSKFKQHPVKVGVYLGLVILIVYLSLGPFVSMLST